MNYVKNEMQEDFANKKFELPDDSGVISHFELPDDSGFENQPVHQDNEKRRDLPRRRRVW